MEALSKVGKYDVVDVLGRGGMGVVYKALDPGIGRMVAIKMMTVGFAENPDLLRRFYREAQSTGALQHPNIVIVYELGDQDGNPYLVMEFLEGESLDKFISTRRQLTLVQRLDILIQMCNGLNYAHSRGVVHRDIKPANIVILKDGGVKIVDFGIARIGGDALTRTGQVVGTINYMSPEQISGQVVDGRSDIFSAGVVAYQLLTSALPFDGNDTAAILLKIINEDPPPLSAYMMDCPSELEDAVLRALTKDRDERYQTADDFGLDLMRVRETLLRQQVNQYIEQAQAAVAKSELAKAKELVLEVLKVDTQNITAKQLLQQIQQMIQKQQRGEQVRQLRELADNAIAQKQHGEALSYLDQALSLDKTNVEMRSLRETVNQAKQQQQKLEDALLRAESAKQADDLESAEEAAAEALKLDANSTRAKTLHASVAKMLAERLRQSKLRDLLGIAAKEISSRRFTAAFEVLRQAEDLDPAAPELHALMKLASTGREQEERRRELETFTADVEDALSRDDFAGACAKADEDLLKFPADPGLLKMRALAEKQRQAGEKKQFIEEQMTSARTLLDAGKTIDALKVLETAVKKVPGDTRLQSMLALLRENAERETVEHRKQQFIRSAKESLRTKSYEKAIEVLEEALAEVEDSAEINDLLQFAREESAQAKRRKRLQETAEEAQRLMAADEYDQAIALLEGALHEIPDEELRLILAEARRHVDDFNKQLEMAISRAQRLLEARKPEEVVALLESQPKSFARSPAFCEVVKRAHEEVERFRQVQKAVTEARAALAKNEFAAAVDTIGACRQSTGDAPELAKCLAEVEGKRAATAKAAVERAMRDGRMLLLARQYNAAQQALDPAKPHIAFLPPELRSQFADLAKQIAEGAARQASEVAKVSSSATQTGGAGQTQVPESYGATVVGIPPAPALAPPATPKPAAMPALAAAKPAVSAAAPAAAPARAREAVAPVAAPAGKKTGLIVAVVAVAVLVLAAVGYFATRGKSGPPPADSYVAVNAIPWGTVKSMNSVDGKTSIPINQETPVRVAVPAGEYKVILTGPDGAERSETIRTSREVPAACTIVFEAIDVEKIINSH
jgi:serine/threonine-protein kinase